MSRSEAAVARPAAAEPPRTAAAASGKLARTYPALVRGAVVYSPSAQVNPGLPGGGNA
ncbi:hypothetical protein [Kitasatospora paranensis]|uniref:Uncharacterized protein n=2 Tax=Kitasatospora paranensis TaxID=258053 RepID=A0ABW2G602_9ACTN